MERLYEKTQRIAQRHLLIAMVAVIALHGTLLYYVTSHHRAFGFAGGMPSDSAGAKGNNS
jgi:hypothetical protein